MDNQDQFNKYMATQLTNYENKLVQISKLELIPLKSLSEEQIQKIREKKDITDQILVFTQMKQHYLNFTSTQEERIYERISKTLLLGPIAMFKPALFKSKVRVQRLREVYQLLLGSHEIADNVSFAHEFVNENIKNLQASLKSESFRQDLEKLYPKVEAINKDEWISLLGQVVDLQTIQEINQTNIDFDLQYSGGSETFQNSLDSDDNPTLEKKGQFNYDGDEEKTPQQSEQEEDKKLIAPWRKALDQEKDESLDSAGYEASNSDRQKKISKAPRVPRNKKKLPGQDFDTDRERENSKKC